MAAKGPLPFVDLTNENDDPAHLAELVTRHAGAALAEADQRKFATGNIVFLVRRAADVDRGAMSGFSREQLEEIRKATPEEGHRLAERHSWTLGRLPPEP